MSIKRNDMPEIEYAETDHQGLDSIEPLWKKLNEEHRVRSKHFSNQYVKRTFLKRKAELLEKHKLGSLHIAMAHDSSTSALIGYCVSTIIKDRGEVDSLYIEPNYRHSGVANDLVKRALDWMDSKLVTKKTIVVAAGNEEVFAFYSRYNFYPRTIILEQVDTDKTG